MNKSILNLIVKNEKIDIPELCIRSINKGLKTEIYPFTDDWHDIGNQIKLRKFQISIVTMLVKVLDIFLIKI